MKHFTNSSSEAGRTDTITQQTRLPREFWTNKTVTEFGASRATQAAFQSDRQDRWSAAERYDKRADTGLDGVARGSSSARRPRSAEKTLPAIVTSVTRLSSTACTQIP